MSISTNDNDTKYKNEVKEDFEKRGFCLCSFKGKNHWYEILDSDWDWDHFDYMIAPYNTSKSVDDHINNSADNMIHDLDSFNS